MLDDYDPAVFSTMTEADARAIILTPEAGMTTAQRWERETAWLAERITFKVPGLVVDYGCGIGRLAKAIENPVLGVDISMTMRRQAETYVSRPDFGIVSPAMFERLINAGIEACGALAVWSLQHADDPAHIIETLFDVLASGATLYVVNRYERVVPTATGWRDDGVNVRELLAERFEETWFNDIPTTLAAAGAYLACYQKR